METKRTPVATGASLHPATLMGTVALTVANLDRQIAFYRELLGFRLHWREGARAGLGAGREDFLLLHELPGARRAPHTTGLYHFAVLFPNRRELARAVARLFSHEYVNHPTDHVITKTTYLKDPEGQEIELYAESPEDGDMGIAQGLPFARRRDGRPSDGRDPLDLDSLFKELGPGDSLGQELPPEARIGHVHLYVRNVAEAIRFYTGVVGFGDMGFAPAFQMGMVSAGGYHHHIGLNAWMGEGAPPAPPGSLGMRHFTVLLHDHGELDRVNARLRAAEVPLEQAENGWIARDPSENSLLLIAPPG